MLALSLLALTGCKPNPDEAARQVIGLSTSLPLVWPERGDIRAQLAETTPTSWAMRVLARRGRVQVLDSLAGAKGLPLPRDALLVLAQPRPLTPDENLALDTWVRRGGRLLLFADPMLTAHSIYALGDPRRPQDVAMLSPILGQWGLDLQFDEDQPAGEHQVPAFGALLPVDLPGRFALKPAAASAVQCRLDAGGLTADCLIGKGRILAIADAAVLGGEDWGRTVPLAALVDRLSR